MWNTTQGGPCIFRPVPYDSFESPNPEQAADQACLKRQSWEWKDGDGVGGPCQVRKWRCPNAKCNEDNILVNAEKVRFINYNEKVNVDLPWNETMTKNEKYKRWLQGTDIRY